MLEVKISELAEQLKSGKSKNERIQAALDLGSIKAKEAVDVLVEQLLVEEDEAVREAIVTSLIKIGDEYVANRAAELLECEDAYVRNAGVEILSIIGGPAIEILRKMINHPDRDVRILAVNALGESHIRETNRYLRRVIMEDNDENVMASAIEYLSELGFEKEDKEVVMRAAKRFSSPFFQYVVKSAIEKMADL
ncbi:HEAT repeat-containing protein [Caldanaerovirga acetigignens]|uniref:HEAT repeat-containing protein n=1 Tax=Caldanaerovirga acetigignens TaxID=447595 RepID=A0A1M7JUC2_9FIRM|nr:HEAT repeat domain-containing protein [Caldanaerovirga acetigignens]SHM56574.1 HEAT repeat-containing protein [Caldanaerovirga acetigignens]